MNPKVDLIDNPADVAKVTSFVLGGVSATLQHTPPLFCVSARDALRERRSSAVGGASGRDGEGKPLPAGATAAGFAEHSQCGKPPPPPSLSPLPLP